MPENIILLSISNIFFCGFSMMISSAFFFLPIWTPTTKIHTWLLVRLSATGWYENRQISVRKNYSNATRSRQSLRILISCGVWQFFILIFTGRKENKIESKKRQNHKKSKSENFYRIEISIVTVSFTWEMISFIGLYTIGHSSMVSFATEVVKMPIKPIYNFKASEKASEKGQ